MKDSIRHQILELAKDGYNDFEIAEIVTIPINDIQEVRIRFGEGIKKVKVKRGNYPKVFELKAKGLSIEQIAEGLNAPVSEIQNVLDRDLSRIQNDRRAKECLELYKSGEPLEAISKRFNLSRERVRQITKKQFGFSLGYGPTEQKVRKNEIENKYRELVHSNRGERQEDYLNRKLDEASNKGVEPKYFDSMVQFLKAVGITKELLKQYRPDVYSSIQKNARLKARRWSRFYDSCRMCGTTEVKHKIYGFCKNCYYKSPEFRSIQERSREKYRENRLLQNKKYSEAYLNRPQVKKRIEKQYDDRYFGGNRSRALKRDGFKCLGCGMSTKEKDKSGRPKVRVWHLNHKDDHALNNLGTYCQRCLYKYKGVNFFKKKRT